MKAAHESKSKVVCLEDGLILLDWLIVKEALQIGPHRGKPNQLDIPHHVHPELLGFDLAPVEYIACLIIFAVFGEDSRQCHGADHDSGAESS